MKYFNVFAFLLLFSVVSFYACNSDSDARKEEARENLVTPETGTNSNSTAPNPETGEPAQNTSGVWHYTCPKGCAGGAGSAGSCAVCGEALTHNQAYHAQNNTNTNATDFNPNSDATNPSTITPPTPEPAQNAAGVWHYTCTAGCEGGAGSAGNCSKCGSPLAHNQEYH